MADSRFAPNQGTTPTDGSRAGKSTPLSVAIGAAGDQIDLGLAFTLRALVSGGTPPYVDEWRDSLGDLYSGAEYTVSLSQTGTYSTTLYGLDSAGHLRSATRTFFVVDPPIAQASVPQGAIDAGVPFPLALSVVGGAPPYQLDWRVASNSSSGDLQGVNASTVTVAASAAIPGTIWADVVVVDSLGAASTTSAWLGIAQPALEIGTNLGPLEAEMGVVLGISANCSGGSSPVRWSGVVAEDGANVSAENGTLNVSGPISWSWTPELPGNATATIRGVDAANGSVEANVNVTVRSPLAIELSLNASTLVANRSANFTAAVLGGWGPYRYTLRLSDGEQFSGVLAAALNLSVETRPMEPGSLNATLIVSDALNRTQSATLSLLVSPSSPGTTPTPPSPGGPASGSSVSVGLDPVVLVLAGVVVAGTGAGLGIRWFLRRPPTVRPVPVDVRPALPWVESTVRESETMDRDSLYLLAEDQGLSLAQVDAAIEHWSRTGQLSTGTTPDGRETVQWIPAHAEAGIPPSEEGSPP